MRLLNDGLRAQVVFGKTDFLIQSSNFAFHIATILPFERQLPPSLVSTFAALLLQASFPHITCMFRFANSGAFLVIHRLGSAKPYPLLQNGEILLKELEVN